MVPILNHSRHININNNITIVIIEIVIEKGLDIVYPEDKGIDKVYTLYTGVYLPRILSLIISFPASLGDQMYFSSTVFNLCPGE